jgi:UDP-arabinose 4-epimerase
MVRVLVTGGAGYIGSHTCKALAFAGHEPVTYDSLEGGFREFVQWGPLEEGNLRDGARLAAVLREYDPAAVLHFAGYIAAGESVADPLKYYENNVVGGLTLLRAMRDMGRDTDIPALVFSSTAAVYGNPETTPIPETHALAPINPYAHSKLFIEQALQDYGAAYGLRWAALRYFNAAGADPDGGIGERHDPETHLIPLAIRAALGTSDPLTIFGDDYDTADGTPIRDYVHVGDLADAHVAALDYLLGGGDSTAMNLGLGNGHSVHDVVTAVERVLGKPVPRRLGKRRPGDPTVLVADAQRASDLLDWTPRFADLDGIVASAAQWESHRR